MSQATFYMTDGTTVRFREIVDISPVPGGVRVQYMGPGDEFTDKITTSVRKETTILSSAYNHYFWTG